MSVKVEQKKYKTEHFVQTMKTPMRNIEERIFTNFEEALAFYKAHKGTCWNGWSYPQEIRETETFYCNVCGKATQWKRNEFKQWICTEHKGVA